MMMRRMAFGAMVGVMALGMGCASKKKVAARRGPAAEVTLMEATGGEVTATTQPTTMGGGGAGGAIPVTVIQGDAVIQRQWPEAVFWRASGDTIAGPTYWDSINDAFKRPDWVNVLMEPAEFLLNTALLPVRAVITPPMTAIQYSPVGPKTDETTARKWKK